MSFPITCTACHKTFTISDEIYEKKVAGRVVTIKCKTCGQGIRVDGTKPKPGSVSEPAPPQAAPAAPSPAASAEPLWAVDYPDGQDREFTTAEVVAELEGGAINGATLIWREGMPEWLELAQVPDLAAELAKVESKRAAAAKAAEQARAAAKPKATPQAEAHKPRAPIPTVTGLAGLPLADLTPPRARQPTPSDDVTPTFGIAAPQRPVQPPPAPTPVRAAAPFPAPAAPQFPAPAVPAAAPVQPLTSTAPLPVPPLTSTAPLPVQPLTSTAPLPVPPALAAKPSAPFAPPSAAQAPQPRSALHFPPAPASMNLGTAPAVVADHATIDWPESKSRAPLIALGLIAVVGLAVVGFVVLGNKDEPLPPIAAAPPSTPLAPAPTASSPSPSSRGSDQPGSDTASGSDPVAAAPAPGSGFAQMFEAGARKAESQGAKVAPSVRFDPAATKAPLAQAANEAQACKQPGGPTGKVAVVVTFDPSGKVSGATISDAPFAGTPTAACITQAFKRASMAPFSGLPGTVSKTFSIL